MYLGDLIVVFPFDEQTCNKKLPVWPTVHEKTTDVIHPVWNGGLLKNVAQKKWLKYSRVLFAYTHILSWKGSPTTAPAFHKRNMYTRYSRTNRSQFVAHI